MPKGYWMAHVTVNSADFYPRYIEAAKPAFEKYGARFVVRGGRYDAVEGPGRPRNVILEFDSYEKAVACYNSPEYQVAAAIRKQCADSELVIVEGVE